MSISLASLSANVLFRFVAMFVQSIWVFLAAIVMTDAQLGEFRYLLSTAMILALFLHAGAPFYLVKTIAAGVPDPRRDTASTLNFVFQAQLYLLPLAVVVVLLWPDLGAGTSAFVLLTAYALAATQLVAFILLGGKRPLAQQLTQEFLPPAGFLVFLGIAAAVGLALDPGTSIIAYCVSAAIAFGVGLFALSRGGPAISLLRLRLVGFAETKSFLHTLAPFMLNQPIRVLIHNTDILMLSWMTDYGTVARYLIVSRMVSLLNIPETALNMVLSPFYAGLPGAKASLAPMIVISALISTISAVIGAVLLLGLHDTLTGFFFDENAGLDQSVMYALIVPALFGVACGPATTVLLMGGFERFNIRITVAALFLNIGLNAALIPFFGALGAALGTAATVIMINSVSLTFVRRKLGLNTTVINRLVVDPATYRDYVASLKSALTRKRRRGGGA